MQTTFVIIGALIGLSLANGGHALFGMGIGAAIGFLLARQRTLQVQLESLKDRVASLSERRTEPETGTVPLPAARPAPQPARKPEPVSLYEPARPEPVSSRPRTLDQPAPAAKFVAPEPPLREPSRPDPLQRLAEAAKSWLTTGNVPVKIGVIVSFFGVAFLLKYAVEHRVLVVPIELRYLAVAAAAVVLLGIGWRLRTRLRVYALSLQGGGIGILFLTIFAAFRLHPILPAPFAFALLVLLTAFAGVLAIVQDARVLAVLGTVGGFLAPVLISTGSGNHVALFSYYLLLNAAILGIAWFRAWRELNVIGFLFTFGVGTMWGYQYYRPELFASTEPFLIAYFLFYEVIAILFAFRQPPRLRGFVDGTLVFGTPVIAFALQSQLVDDTEYGLAISAMAVAIFYTLVATWLHRTQGRQMRLLTESFLALGVAFATISVPLALDNRWTAVAWALEGAALVWVGVRQQRMLARLTGTALLFASGVAFLEDGWRTGMAVPVLNGNFLGGMLIAISSLFSARYLAADRHALRWQAYLSVPLLVWGLIWWGGTGAWEIRDWAPRDVQLHLLTAFVAVSVSILAWIGRRYDWTAARRATLAFLPLLLVFALLYLIKYQHVFAGVGTLSWIVAALAHFGLLRVYDDGRGRLESLWHFAGAVFIVAIFAAEAYWRIDRSYSEVWATTGALFMPLFGTVVIVFGRERLAWPLQRYWSSYLVAAAALIGAQLLLTAGAGIGDPGSPAPLPYVPLLNPFDLLTIAGLVVAWYFLSTVRTTSSYFQREQLRVAYTVWGVAAFVLTTIAVVRGVYHFDAVPWDDRALAHSVSVQSALSIFWAILGLSGMVWGARHATRWIWLTAAALMAVVVAKLFIIDLGNTGTVARIISFLGVGVMLLVVGYFAPAPPKAPETDNADA
jgi:uncharacterized membrane protein